MRGWNERSGRGNWGWGESIPLTFAIGRRGKGGGKPVAVFRFLSEDWSPWIALLHMRERWSELSFKLIPSYVHTD
jgi:hypothetical protein